LVVACAGGQTELELANEGVGIEHRASIPPRF
jgi:hypothetical protein